MSTRNHPLPPTWGEGVREMRKIRGLSQAALALKAGVGQAHISRLEHNLGKHSVVVLVKVAGALGVDPNELFPLQDKPRTNGDGEATG